MSTMEWYELAYNPQAVLQMYTTSPSLDQVRLIEVMLETRRWLRLRAELTQFPDKPSPRWLRDKLNTVAIQLDFWGVEAVQIVGWHVHNVVNLHIAQIENGRIGVATDGGACTLDFTCDFFRIDRFDAYRMEDGVAP